MISYGLYTHSFGSGHVRRRSFYQHDTCLYKNRDGEVAEAMQNQMLQRERRVLYERRRFWWGARALGVRSAVGEFPADSAPYTPPYTIDPAKAKIPAIAEATPRISAMPLLYS